MGVKYHAQNGVVNGELERQYPLQNRLRQSDTVSDGTITLGAGSADVIPGEANGSNDRSGDHQGGGKAIPLLLFVFMRNRSPHLPIAYQNRRTQGEYASGITP